MVWILLLGLIFGMGGAFEETHNARIELPACPSIDVSGVLHATYPNAHIEILNKKYIKCKNMEAILEVDAQINGKKLKLELSKKGSKANTTIRIIEGDDKEFLINETLVYPIGEVDNNTIIEGDDSVWPENETFVIVKDGVASFWYIKNNKVIKIKRGNAAKCRESSAEVWIAKEGYPIKKIKITKPGCYIVDFEKDLVRYNRCNKKMVPTDVEERKIKILPKPKIEGDAEGKPSNARNEILAIVEEGSTRNIVNKSVIKAKIKQLYGDVKIVNISIVSKNKVVVIYKSKVKIPFLGVELPIETEQKAEIDLES